MEFLVLNIRTGDSIKKTDLLVEDKGTSYSLYSFFLPESLKKIQTAFYKYLHYYSYCNI